jgi:hypothetical protein
MRVLVDEGMPVQVIPSLRLNRRHQFDHVDELRWKGKPDVQLFTDAAARGYDAVLTLDLSQLDSADESRALKRSGLHHTSPTGAERLSSPWMAAGARAPFTTVSADRARRAPCASSAPGCAG